MPQLFSFELLPFLEGEIWVRQEGINTYTCIGILVNFLLRLGSLNSLRIRTIRPLPQPKVALISRSLIPCCNRQTIIPFPVAWSAPPLPVAKESYFPRRLTISCSPSFFLADSKAFASRISSFSLLVGFFVFRGGTKRP